MKKYFKKIALIMSLILFTIPILNPVSNTNGYKPLVVDESEILITRY